MAEKLNSLVLSAQSGCESSRWSIVSIFTETISSMADKHRHRVHSLESLESDLYKRLDRAINGYRPGERGFRGYVMQTLQHGLIKALSRQRIVVDYYDPTADSGHDNEAGERNSSIISQLVDVLADVEAEAISSSEIERIALLAEGDSLRKSILANWIDGFNDSESAALLAQRYGGKSESRRKTIQRFRSACRAALAS